MTRAPQLISPAVGRCVRRLAIAGVCAAGLVAPAQAAQTLGFVVTWFGLANNQGAGDCPEGPTVKTDEQAMLSRLPAKERARLLLTQNTRERFQFLTARGPDGIDACQHPEAVVEPPLRTVQGKTAYGVDLDGVGSGARTPNTCAHENFTGLDGTPGVDNQFSRVTGCMFGLREDGVGGYIEKYFNSVMRDGNWAILIELKGVDNTKDDPDVEVGIYKSADPMVRDAQGTNILSGASLQIGDDPHYQQHTRGKIVNGVLTTDPVDIFVEPSKNYIKPEMLFRDGRLKLELAADGTAKGVLAGYIDWKQQFHTKSRAGAFAEMATGYTCPALYAALKANADGHPDPKTGQCTTISSAYLIEAIPAFVIHPEKAKAAEAKQKNQKLALEKVQ